MANAGYAPKGKRPSREEMRKTQPVPPKPQPGRPKVEAKTDPGVDLTEWEAAIAASSNMKELTGVGNTIALLTLSRFDEAKLRNAWNDRKSQLRVQPDPVEPPDQGPLA